ncbi:MAG: cob(I)yrinic acid a,c-diamide adenosyltransferase [Gammaproteobacteria bacterium]|jgi:cob(I)alamin adenosyltransferase
MGNRLTRIYTRTGDEGLTGLGNGERISKTALRIEAMGDIDEVNCLLGMVLSESPDEEITEIIIDMQHALFDAGGEISLPGNVFITDKYILRVEHAIDKLNNELESLKEFILPGGGKASSICHLARSVCRRAERHLVGLGNEEAVNSITLQLLNRLSDLLFVVARTLARRETIPEMMWDKRRWADEGSNIS